jgi:hypothetical protein
MRSPVAFGKSMALSKLQSAIPAFNAPRPTPENVLNINAGRRVAATAALPALGTSGAFILQLDAANGGLDGTQAQLQKLQ